jgi:hypothetical protein
MISGNESEHCFQLSAIINASSEIIITVLLPLALHFKIQFSVQKPNTPGSSTSVSGSLICYILILRCARSSAKLVAAEQITAEGIMLEYITIRKRMFKIFLFYIQ